MVDLDPRIRTLISSLIDSLFDRTTNLKCCQHTDSDRMAENKEIDKGTIFYFFAFDTDIRKKK